MTADIINLRRLRKRKDRLDGAERAAENRVRYGRTTGERQVAALAEKQAARHLDGHRLGAAAPIEADPAAPDDRAGRS